MRTSFIIWVRTIKELESWTLKMNLLRNEKLFSTHIIHIYVLWIFLLIIIVQIFKIQQYIVKIFIFISLNRFKYKNLMVSKFIIIFIWRLTSLKSLSLSIALMENLIKLMKSIFDIIIGITNLFKMIDTRTTVTFKIFKNTSNKSCLIFYII